MRLDVSEYLVIVQNELTVEQFKHEHITDVGTKQAGENSLNST